MRALIAFWLVVALAVVVAMAAAPKRVAFIRPPHVVAEHDSVTFQIRVEPNAANRTLIIAATDGEFVVRSSAEPLDGDKAPITRWVRWLLPPCDPCVIVAALYGVSGKELARAESDLIVVHPGP